jgi:hypothetical protein
MLPPQNFAHMGSTHLGEEQIHSERGFLVHQVALELRDGLLTRISVSCCSIGVSKLRVARGLPKELRGVAHAPDHAQAAIVRHCGRELCGAYRGS